MGKKNRNNNKKGKKTNAASKLATPMSLPLPSTDNFENNDCNENADKMNGLLELVSFLDVAFEKKLKELQSKEDNEAKANMTKEEGEEWNKREKEKELHEVVLFKEHLAPDDCDICALPLPIVASEKSYKVCCGKVICFGCVDTMRETNCESWDDVCPFCREITTSSNMLQRVEKRVALNDPNALATLADMHFQGIYGMPKDIGKAFKLMAKAGELGHAEVLCSLGNFYYHGEYVEKDVPKSKHFLELAAMKGSIEARHLLACLEERSVTPGRIGRGMKHFLIAARAGYEPSMKAVEKGSRVGYVAKEEYEETLRAYQDRVDSMKSVQRHRTKAFNTPIDDEALFKDPPPRENCPICSLTLPFGHGATYNACCGTTVCGGCILAQELNGRGYSCITCGAWAESDFDELMKRIKKRMDSNDACAFNMMGTMHNAGNFGVRLDQKKAIELWTRAGELGSGKALCNVALSYDKGEGVKRSEMKATYYYEQAAIKGDAEARHNLGSHEGAAGNHDRAVKHFVIAAKAGVPNSMKMLREKYAKGDSCISKDLFEKTLRAHHDAATEMRSKQRDKAASYLAQGLGTSVPNDKKEPHTNPGNKMKQAKGKKTKA